jgi:hypothetical protein
MQDVGVVLLCCRRAFCDAGIGCTMGPRDKPEDGIVMPSRHQHDATYNFAGFEVVDGGVGF